jgi:hypothetical protein
VDPNAALAELRNAIAEGDRAQAREIALDLIRWLDTGGFPPAGFNRDDARSAVIALIGGAIATHAIDRTVDKTN